MSAAPKAEALLRITASVVLAVIVAGLLAGCRPPEVRALLDGKRYVEKGEYERAIERLTNATTLLPTNAVVWNYLGLAYQYSGQRTEAQAAYEHALAQDRDLMEAHYNLGCLWLEQNRPDKLEAAKSHLTSFCLRRPTSVPGLVKLGTAQMRLRELTAAEKSLAEAVRLSPKDVEALNGLGLARLQRGRTAEAAQAFAAALKERPDYPPAILNLAIVEHQYLHNKQAALSRYQQYVALKPTPPGVEALTAVIRQLEQELAPAQRALASGGVAGSAAAQAPPGTNLIRTVARAAPTNAVTSRPPALLSPKVEAGAVAPKIVAAANAPKTAAPSVPAPAPAPAPELAKAAVEKKAEPKPASGTRVEGVPRGPRYKYLMPAKPAAGNRAAAEREFAQGLQLQERRRLSEAAGAYLRAIELDPSFFGARYNLALAKAELGDLRGALAEYEYALAIDGDSANARYNFALVLKAAGYIADAVNELERLTVSAPNDARAHLALGNLYAQQLQEPANARVHYMKALELDPNGAQAAAVRYWLAANPK